MKIRIQEDIKDCGIYALQSLYKFYWKKWLDINQLKYYASYNENGISISNLIEIGKEISIEIEAYKANFEELVNSKINFPCLSIIKIDNFFHYVIIKKIKNGIVETYDSVNGKRELDLLIFKESFSGIVLFVSKSKTNSIKKSFLEKQKTPFQINFSSILVFLIFSFISVLINYFVSFINKFVFSYIQNSEWLQANKNLLLLFWSSITLILISFLNSLASGIIKTKIAKNIKNDFIKKIENAQYQQLMKIEQNEIILRYLSINLISNFYANIFSFWPTFIFFLTLSIPLLFYISFNYIILIISLNLIKTILGYLINIKIFSWSKRNIVRNLNEINDLTFFAKNNDTYSKSFWRNMNFFDFKQTIELNQKNENKINNFNSIKTFLFSLLTLLSNILIFLIFINQKNNNVSEIFFIFQIQNLLNEPINNFQFFLLDKKVNKINIERLFFILDIPEKINNKNQKNPSKISEIKIKNLNFGYSTKTLFSNINLDIKNNLIISGKNGAGKTTFLKILLGYFDDIKNSIFINNIPIENIEKNWLIDNIYFSDKDNNFPNTDLYSYLFWNVEQKDRENILQNKEFLSLLKDLNLDLFSNLFLQKNKFSMGQIQVIKLLPLMIKKYQLILLDESLEFIAKNTLKIIRNLVLEKQENSIFIETSHTKRYLAKNHKIFKLK
ncbi:Mbov_0121 family peptidase domain-containing ABC transporter [Metamycoplasma alkalescens]|uniref:ABC-type bacteriocin/lantibiotic exporter with double-glycine peptidase domain n=1 Tax=Metamycoplasma alkalescens TaxID=45363 RepID=A0A318U8Z5_9BACT|nr:cysteine peptidase family C39 domain-containing protein [Metamycoplasma alkalescens]PYF43751.1 ABC-type bacteriocin/lantibiotic exporter with double-glycine peptidase domain [Metamycoplasma alkalescens]